MTGKSDQRRWKSCTRKINKRGGIQSSTGHEEFRVKTGGPPPKAKYYLVTDSGEVLWRKGEKNPGRGVKENLKPYVYKQTKDIKVRCRTFCRTVRRVIVCSEVKYLRYEAEVKPSLNRAQVTCNRPETEWSIHDQDEVGVKSNGGPNSLSLKRHGMNCG